MKIDIEPIAEQLIEADEKAAEADISYNKVMQEYEHKKDQFYLRSGMVTGPLKMAETMENLRQDPIFEKYNDALMRCKITDRRWRTLNTILIKLRVKNNYE